MVVKSVLRFRVPYNRLANILLVQVGSAPLLYFNTKKAHFDQGASYIYRDPIDMYKS